MSEEFRQNGINGWIAEPFGSEEGGPSIALWMIPLLNYMPHFTSQIMIHPTQNNEEIITDFSTVETPEKMEKYLEENMYKFNYKPLKVFDEKATREEYIEFIEDILSKQGWIDSDGTVYKAKVNKIDGIYKLL
jgi:hypothetical protein